VVASRFIGSSTARSVDLCQVAMPLKTRNSAHPAGSYQMKLDHFHVAVYARFTTTWASSYVVIEIGERLPYRHARSAGARHQVVGE
jgi:hypothetical protein